MSKSVFKFKNLSTIINVFLQNLFRIYIIHENVIFVFLKPDKWILKYLL